jgi:hypothetical protein
MICRRNRINDKEEVLINSVWKNTEWTHNQTICRATEIDGDEQIIQHQIDENREYKFGEIEYNLAQAYVHKSIKDIATIRREARQAGIRINEAMVQEYINDFQEANR